jgi:hypothetical protein
MHIRTSPTCGVVCRISSPSNSGLYVGRGPGLSLLCCAAPGQFQEMSFDSWRRAKGRARVVQALETRAMEQAGFHGHQMPPRLPGPFDPAQLLHHCRDSAGQLNEQFELNNSMPPAEAWDVAEYNREMAAALARQSRAAPKHKSKASTTPEQWQAPIGLDKWRRLKGRAAVTRAWE